LGYSARGAKKGELRFLLNTYLCSVETSVTIYNRHSVVFQRTLMLQPYQVFL